MKNLKACLCEFIGVFFLIFTGVGSIIINDQTNNGLGNLGISMTFGSIIMIMIYACGHISGAQFNPAVTIALGIFNKMDRKLAIPYIISQVFGAICGSTILKILFGQQGKLGVTNPKISAAGSLVWASFAFEFIFTFLLMFVILNVAVHKNANKSFSGLIIGIVIFIGAAIAGPVSGGSFNPARSIGPAVVNMDYQYLWIYIVSPIIAAISGGALFEFISKNEEVSDNTVEA
ncbi:MIP/aquaporin family protein [Clostridium sp.]|uniref:MIP/aquaporin family protein n=1 Tax=Clostridium sp. TaxID=1506 RepID=UPI0026391DD2|nr:aquaporin [Clostridium sp.]